MKVLTTKKKLFICESTIYIYMKWDVGDLWDVWDVQRPKRFERPGMFAQIAKPNLANVPRQTLFV